ncbi:MAG: PDZ domain-containing protein [Gemmatimonadaceae bacterium]|nr:PDZ domain-containing protein [Gemmatimonadaceae bacterium]
MVARLALPMLALALAASPAAAHGLLAQQRPGVDSAALRDSRAAVARERARDSTSVVRARAQFERTLGALQRKLQLQYGEQARMLAELDREVARARTVSSTARDSIRRTLEPRLAAAAQRIGEIQREMDEVVGQQIEREMERAVAELADAESPAAVSMQRAMAIEYSRAAAQMTAMARALAAQQQSLTYRVTNGQPRGRLGVTLSGAQEWIARDGRMITQYRGPQVIESVEPGGPADKAGIEAGDTLVALGRTRIEDAEVAIAELLVPGETLPVRVRRNGRERTMQVTVAERKVTVQGVAVTPFARIDPCAWGEACSVNVTVGTATPVPPRPPAPARAPSAAQTIVGGATSWRETYDGSMAGAVLVTIDDDLEEILGTDEGALVLRVAPGTPAADAGLRAGDVIVRVDDRDVRTPRDVRRRMATTAERGSRSMALVVMRKGAKRAVTLQW